VAEGTKAVAFAIDARVERQENPDVVAEPLECLRERERDIGEPAGFGERRDLGREKSDANRPHGTAEYNLPRLPC
jgi:hypothetical protein